jgi:polyisoprenoid-binding protein YceI
MAAEKAAIKTIDELKGNYDVDGAHSSVNFSVLHLVTFTKGSINIDSGLVDFTNPASPRIYIRMDAKSINTQNSFRDDHLKNKEEFFDVAKYPKIVYEATEIVKDSTAGEYNYIAKGKLTMKGITKETDMHFKYIGTSNQEWDGKKFEIAGFEGKTVINRGDFNVGNAGGIGDDITITITLEAMKELK